MMAMRFDCTIVVRGLGRHRFSKTNVNYLIFVVVVVVCLGFFSWFVLDFFLDEGEREEVEKSDDLVFFFPFIQLIVK